MTLETGVNSCTSLTFSVKLLKDCQFSVFVSCCTWLYFCQFHVSAVLLLCFTLSEVLACNDVVSESVSFLCLKITWRLMASKSYLPYTYKSALYPGCIFDSSHTINRCTFGTISETGATIFVRHYFISRCHMSPGILNIFVSLCKRATTFLLFLYLS